MRAGVQYLHWLLGDALNTVLGPRICAVQNMTVQSSDTDVSVCADLYFGSLVRVHCGSLVYMHKFTEDLGDPCTRPTVRDIYVPGGRPIARIPARRPHVRGAGDRAASARQ